MGGVVLGFRKLSSLESRRGLVSRFDVCICVYVDIHIKVYVCIYIAIYISTYTCIYTCAKGSF